MEILEEHLFSTFKVVLYLGSNLQSAHTKLFHGLHCITAPITVILSSPLYTIIDTTLLCFTPIRSE